MSTPHQQPRGSDWIVPGAPDAISFDEHQRRQAANPLSSTLTPPFTYEEFVRSRLANPSPAALRPPTATAPARQYDPAIDLEITTLKQSIAAADAEIAWLRRVASTGNALFAVVKRDNAAGSVGSTPSPLVADAMKRRK